MKQTLPLSQPPLGFIPPCMSPGIVRMLGVALPWWLRTNAGIDRLEVQNSERLLTMYHEFQEGKVRFIMAFRHPSITDPMALGAVLDSYLPQEARRVGRPLQRQPHTYFLYDRGIPLWAGPMVGWLLPRAGGISVQRGKLDRQSLRMTRDLLANGDQPLIVAPEGGTNGLNDVLSPLEPGVAQMAFWCLEDLRGKERTEKVYIVPLGLRYIFLEPPWTELGAMVSTLEEECGLQPDTTLDRYARLARLAERLLGLLEEYYTRFYQQTLTPDADVPMRLKNLIDAGLRVSEQFFALKSQGEFADRCRRIEQASWERIYREDLKDKILSPVERGLADRIAGEATMRVWPMRLVEGFISVSGTYVQENPTVERFAEMVNLLYITVQRLKGSETFTPPTLGKRRAVVTVQEPILVDTRWEQYQTNRHSARAAVADLTKDLQTSMEEAMKATEPQSSTP